MVQWLTKQPWKWDLFATFTFRTPTSRDLTARSRLNSWLSRFAEVPLLNPVRWCLWSAERHSTGNVHIHALLECTGNTSWQHCKRCNHVFAHGRPLWSALKESWYVHHGIARVYPFDPTRQIGGVNYVVWYILSEESVDWDLYHGVH